VFKKYLLRPLIVSAIIVVLAIFSLVSFLGYCTYMPGTPHAGPLPDEDHAVLREQLREDVELLSGLRRNYSKPDEYESSAVYIEERLAGLGLSSTRQTVSTERGDAFNILSQIDGESAPKEVVVLGAHYDSYAHTPGADDNASGVAGLLELARLLQTKKPGRTVILAFYANEEPPYFQTDGMGSLVHARSLVAQQDLKPVAMFSLEMLGYYDTAAGSQKYPPVLSWFYPDTGDFVAFVGSLAFRDIVTESVGVFRNKVRFPAYGFSGPGFMREVGFSDQWSYWQVGIPALMVTDTAFFRNHHYHQGSDTPDTLDWDRFPRVVAGIEPVMRYWTDPQ